MCKDVELRHTSNNIAVANFTIAVDNRFKKDSAQFINIIAWEKTGEFVSKYFSKGVRIAVSGRIENRTWEDSEGNKRYATDVIAEEVYFADGKKNEEVVSNNEDSDDLPF